MRLISTKLGTLLKVQIPEQRIAPAISTKAEFLAPLILTFPCKDARPQISRTAGESSVVTGVVVGLEIELMALSSG